MEAQPGVTAGTGGIATSVIQRCPKATQGDSPQTRTAAPKKKYSCTVSSCTYTTPSERDMIRHRRKHTGEKPFKCEVCHKAFSRADKVKTHRMIHTKDRPHKCALCDYSAVYIDSLKKHMRTHTKERPYKCQLCDYRSKDPSQLTVHLRSHTGDQPYVCDHDGCEASFTTSSGLVRHKRLHTNTKPYKCTICSYSAAVKCNLNVHMKKRHAADNDKESELTNSKSSHNVVSKESSHTTGKAVDDECTILKNQPVSSVDNRCTEQKSKAVTKPRKLLPFEYSCRECDFLADTYRRFMSHFKRQHPDKVNQYKKEKLAVSLQKTEEATLLENNMKKQKKYVGFSKQFQCSFCPSAFVRQDSLNCHIKQHSESKIQPPGFQSHTVYAKVPQYSASKNPCSVNMDMDNEIIFPTTVTTTNSNGPILRHANQSVIVSSYTHTHHESTHDIIECNEINSLDDNS